MGVVYLLYSYPIPHIHLRPCGSPSSAAPASSPQPRAKGSLAQI